MTAGPVHNLGAALQLDGFRVGRWVAQGGFAGEGVMPRYLQIAKFAGRESCVSCNFQAHDSVIRALSSTNIGREVFVSKKVCHRTNYDIDLHEAIAATIQELEAIGEVRRSWALKLIY